MERSFEVTENYGEVILEGSLFTIQGNRVFSLFQVASPMVVGMNYVFLSPKMRASTVISTVRSDGM